MFRKDTQETHSDLLSASDDARKVSPVVHGYPLVGVLPRLILNPPQFLLQVAKEYPGSLPILQFGPVKVFMVVRPNHVQHVLNDNVRNFAKGDMWRPLRRLVGNGLASSEGEVWRRSRRLMQPLFAPKRIARLADLMTKVVMADVRRLEPAANRGEQLDVGKEMMHITQRVLLETLFGTSIDHREAVRLGDAVMEAFRTINHRLFLFFLPDQIPLPGEQTLRRAIETIDEGMLRLLRDRRRSGKEHADLLSLLEQARDEETGTGFDDRQLRDEIVTMFAAGNETTAIAMTWLWYVLDEYPEIDRKLRAEVQSVVGDRVPTVDDLANLHYTKMVIQETMRLFPPAWFFPRVALGDDVIDGHPIPAGSVLLLSPYVTHRDPAFWESPSTFNPERFLPDKVAARPRCAYLPFGSGARQCIGSYFAMMEAELITVMMVQKYRLRRVWGSSVEPWSMSTLRPRGGMKMTLGFA